MINQDVGSLQPTMRSRVSTCRTIAALLLIYALHPSSQHVLVKTTPYVVGQRGEEIVLHCRYLVSDTTSDNDYSDYYVVRWKKYSLEDTTSWSTWNHAERFNEGNTKATLEIPQTKYKLVNNRDLVIPNMDKSDSGRFCCEIRIELKDNKYDECDQSCTRVYFISFKRDTWKAVDEEGTSLILNSNHFITDKVPPVTLAIDISYNQVYPPCDLSLYQKTVVQGRESLRLLDTKLWERVSPVHELYTVEIAVRRQVSCTGPQDVTRLVAKLENCKSDADADWLHRVPGNFMCSPRDGGVLRLAQKKIDYIALEKDFTIICIEKCSPPCQNRGVCTKGKCYCPDGYFGRHCECDVTTDVGKSGCNVTAPTTPPVGDGAPEKRLAYWQLRAAAAAGSCVAVGLIGVVVGYIVTKKVAGKSSTSVMPLVERQSDFESSEEG